MNRDNQLSSHISRRKHMIEGKALSKMSSVYRNQELLFHMNTWVPVLQNSPSNSFSLWSLNMYYQAQNLNRKYAAVFFLPVETFHSLFLIK